MLIETTVLLVSPEDLSYVTFAFCAIKCIFDRGGGISMTVREKT